ncbi:NACHT domain-containing protein [Duganella sp. PWIR1]
MNENNKPAATNGASLATSTAASGPAGSHFEGQVAASYLLAMLSCAPPRGLPGTMIERVALQQANTGRALDDVVIHAHDISGGKAVLEIQVKRDITFSPADPIFRKVVGQIVRASRHEDFSKVRYELAIATTKGSRKIDGAYQDVLMLARQIGDATTFVAQIGLAGAANDDMRAFVQTFRTHLRDEGAPDDDISTWQLLRRLQILTFDFTATGSASEDLARERAAHVLHGDDVSRAGALWGVLVETAINVAKNGGDRTRETLLQLLSSLGFRFVGDRRHATARSALAEASRLAVADIRNRVGNVVLTRQERIAAVYDALDRGRYVEIRGDAGVGKSGVLRHLAEQLSAEGQVVVLSPGRCVPRGWQAMRAQLGFDGSIRELLVELANDGGVVLFIDNLDFFTDEERLTVVDLVQEAASVPGIALVTTVRQGFDVEEPTWLPADALDRLGRTTPIEINGLSKAEIEQLKAGDPALAQLLADSHPAHQVTRNLFRLARLAGQTVTDPLPRTEIDMAVQWWKTADGIVDKGWRDRGRLLQDAAEQTLRRADTLDVKGRSSESIDALIASGTFRNLGIDQVAFRHDVFREWAIANVLHADGSWIDRLSLERPAPATLARGIELAARAAIERATDGSAWYSLVGRLSRTGAHQSWRRAAMLALVRTEAGTVALQRAAPELNKDNAALLRELIRTVLAVEVVPAATQWTPDVLRALGVDPEIVPTNLNIPRGSVWLELILWLLSLGDTVPTAAIPEIVELYTTFSIGTFGLTDITPLVTRHIYRWLRLMEPSDAMLSLNQGAVFWAGLQREQLQSLKSDLRSAFLMFCKHTPKLAAEYLRAVAQSKYNDDLVRSILKMRGTLAQAAPAELADITAQALIEKLRPRDHHFGHEREEAFTFLDSEFLPASPAQGPFFDLLTNAPTDGLALVRKLVDHAVAHGSRGRSPETDMINLPLAGGPRSFPWTQTYFWSRGSHYYSVTSALMALEAWAHHRIDTGAAFEDVLADVLGPVASPAAYLLVAVDLIISHWPKSEDVAAEFLGCPELLCLDHTRQVHDSHEELDFVLAGAWRPEPRGSVSRVELKRRASRRTTLDEMIGNYALTVTQEQRAKLVALLQQAAVRLGPPDPESTLGNPAFMVLHALNLAEPANWREVAVPLTDGSIKTARQYVSPAAEQLHLQALRDVAAASTADLATQSAIRLAVENPSYLSPQARSAAVAWARRVASEAGPMLEESDDDGTQRMQKMSVLTAAMIVMRDGDDALRAQNQAWARAQLEAALNAGEDDPVHQIRTGLHYNPTATAYLGMIYALRYRNSREDVRALLEIVAGDNPAVAHGFGAAISVLAAIDSRLPPALLRCALSSCVVPNREWNLAAEEVTARAKRRLQCAKAAVDAEIEWLMDSGQEPKWPLAPHEHARRKKSVRFPQTPRIDEKIPEPQPATEYFNHQAAALWLRQAHGLLDEKAPPWFLELVRTYMPWTIRANGAELDDWDEADHPPMEWNNAFFALAARCMAGLKFEEATTMVVKPITTLPDRHFFNVVADFQRGIDSVYFGEGDISTSVAVEIRAALATRMMTSRGWERLKGSKEMSIEMHIGPAIAVLFFNDHYFAQSTKCYLHPKGAERVGPFLPLLEGLTKSAPSPFVALVLLNLLEVAPHPEYLDILVVAGGAWLGAYSDFRPFWVDHSFGRRWCAIVENICTQVPAAVDSQLPIRDAIDGIVAALVSLGIPEASRLEEALARI